LLWLRRSMREPFARSDEPRSHRAGSNTLCGFPTVLVGHDYPTGHARVAKSSRSIGPPEHPKTDRGVSRSGTGGGRPRSVLDFPCLMVHSTVRSAYLNSGKRRALLDGANFYRSALPNRAGF
jgi:hypothetical protein